MEKMQTVKINNEWWKLHGMYMVFHAMQEYAICVDLSYMKLVLTKVENGELPLDYVSYLFE